MKPLQYFSQTFDMIKLKLGWDSNKIHAWIDTENPNFGNASPKALIQMGLGNKVLSFVKDRLEDYKK